MTAGIAPRLRPLRESQDAVDLADDPHQPSTQCVLLHEPADAPSVGFTCIANHVTDEEIDSILERRRALHLVVPDSPFDAVEVPQHEAP